MVIVVRNMILFMKPSYEIILSIWKIYLLRYNRLTISDIRFGFVYFRQNTYNLYQSVKLFGIKDVTIILHKHEMSCYELQ